MTQSNYYGGVVEYVASALLLLQFFLGRAWLRARRVSWPHGAMSAVAAVLALMWVVSLFAVFLSWTGLMYSYSFIPVNLRAAVVAAGYFWLLLSALAGGLIFAGRLLAAKIPGRHSSSRRYLLRAAGVAAIAAPSVAVAFGALVERNNYGIAELDFPVPDLHPDLDGFRIVQVSDLHVSPFLSPKQAARAIDMANELHADLAVFTGDLISEPGDPLDDAIRELIRLRADHGVLACMGNHEQYVGCEDYMAAETAKAGMIFLRNSTSQIRRGNGVLNIAGVDYQKSTEHANYLRGTEKLIDPSAANLLLSHNPDVFPVAARRGFQAMLGGHTHGGQINVEILHQNINPARFRTPFISGLYRQAMPGAKPASCFVTNGIGTIGMPIRLGAPPEIALLRLRRA